MDYSMTYGWGFYFFPVFFFLLVFAALWWPGARSRYRGGRYDETGSAFRNGFPFASGWEWGGPFGHDVLPFRGKGPKGYRRADARIVEDLSDRFSVGYFDASDVEVHSADGHVRLVGRVASRRDKRLAEAIAEMVPGVTDVTNELRVGVGERNGRSAA